MEEILMSLNEHEKQILLKELNISEKQMLDKVREEDEKRLGTWGKFDRKIGD